MFGDKLRGLRTSKNLSQEKLGSILNVSSNAVYSWEVGKTQPSIEMITKIAKYFDVTPNYLLGFNQEDKDNIERLKITLKEAGLFNGEDEDMTKEDFEKAMAIVRTLKEQEKK